MKASILQLLQSENTVVSGEALSEKLGVSRVSIWKHIQKLRENGYGIESTAKGYRFVSRPESVFPWDFPGREHLVRHYPDTVSTMDIAREMARNGCPDSTVVVADRQAKGRGRLNREWHSSDGGLYFTMVLRPELPPVFSFRINFAASHVLATTLRQMFAVNARVKWPNDILVDGRKLSGMLSEMEAEGERVSFINIGIGLNVNNDPAVEGSLAVSLQELLGRKTSRREILTRFLDAFDERRKKPLDSIIDEWKQDTITLGQRVKIVTVRHEFEGRAVDVDSTGALVLQLDDGSMESVIYGDCFHTAPQTDQQESKSIWNSRTNST